MFKKRNLLIITIGIFTLAFLTAIIFSNNSQEIQLAPGGSINLQGFSEGINFNPTEIPTTNTPASGNSQTTKPTNYVLQVEVTEATADLYIRAEGDLTSNGNQIPLEGQSYSFSTTDPTVTGEIKQQFTGLNQLIAQDLPPGMHTFYFNFYLDINNPNQAPGEYTNGINFDLTIQAQTQDSQAPTIQTFDATPGYNIEEVLINYGAQENPTPTDSITYILFKSQDQTLMQTITPEVVTSYLQNPFPLPPELQILLFENFPGGSTKTYIDTSVIFKEVYHYGLAACDASLNCEVNHLTNIEMPSFEFTVQDINFEYDFANIEVVFDYSAGEICETNDVPDGPAKVIRQDNGELFMVATHAPTSYFIKGPDFNNLQKDCSEPFFSPENSIDPSQFSNYEWPWSPYKEGGRIHILTHMEFHDTLNSPPCTNDPGASNPCWYNSINYMYSTDGGITFEQPTPINHLVAAPPEQWNTETMIGEIGADGYAVWGTASYGYMNPSNIIEKDGYYYAMFFAPKNDLTPTVWGPDGHSFGRVCIIRTQDLSDPSSWKAWDGNGFDLTLESPYENPNREDCKPLPNSQAASESLTYNTYLEKYVRIGQASWENQEFSCGFFISLSDDLINWEPLHKFIPINQPFGQTGVHENCIGGYFPGVEVNMYPSLIDHGSTSENFETADNTFYIYWTRLNSGNSKDRDLVRMPVTISVPGLN